MTKLVLPIGALLLDPLVHFMHLVPKGIVKTEGN